MRSYKSVTVAYLKRELLLRLHVHSPYNNPIKPVKCMWHVVEVKEVQQIKTSFVSVAGSPNPCPKSACLIDVSDFKYTFF